MLEVARRVYLITKLSDKVLLTMILFLNLELASKMVFYTMNAFHGEHMADGEDESPDPLTIPLVMPIIFLLIAIVINLRNW